MFETPDLPMQFAAAMKAVEWAGGCPTFWGARPEKTRLRENAAWCELSLVSITPIGDERRYSDKGDVLQETLCQLRDIALQANFRSRSQALNSAAWNNAVRCEGRLGSNFAQKNFFYGNEIALIDNGSVINADFLHDNRDECSALLEFRVAVALNDTDENMVVSWIEKTKVTSDLTHADGTASAVQIVDEVMP